MKDCIKIVGGRSRYFLDNRQVTAREYRRRYPLPKVGKGTAGAHGTGWPMVSEAMAVHPTQRKEAEEAAKKLGVPTQFNKLGQPIFTDRAHRKAYCEAYGVYDRNGGYGDPQPGRFKRPEITDFIDV